MAAINQSLNDYFFSKESPYSLQHLCRRTIVLSLVDRVGLISVVTCCKVLPLPTTVIDYLCNTCNQEIADIRTLKWGSSGKYTIYGETVAVLFKNIGHKQQRDEIFRDIKKWRALNHDNICKVIASFEENDMIGVLYQPGYHSLSDIITHLKQIGEMIPEIIIWKILNQLSSALLHLDKNKIKLQKLSDKIITITRNWDVLICNISMDTYMLYDIKQDRNQGVYASPEYIQGISCDQQYTWFIGCIAYELMYRETAYHSAQGLSLYETLLNIVQGLPPSKLHLTLGYSENLRTFISVCLTHVTQARPTLAQVYELTEHKNSKSK